MGRKRRERSVFEVARDIVKEDLKPIKEVIAKSIKKKKINVNSIQTQTKVQSVGPDQTLVEPSSVPTSILKSASGRKRKEKKKKVKKKDALCKYCKLFQGSDDRRLIKDGTSLIDYRKCPKAKKEVADLTEACDHFEINHVFWCDSLECWINVKACVSRHKKGENGCVRCRQGRTIREIEKEKR